MNLESLTMALFTSQNLFVGIENKKLEKKILQLAHGYNIIIKSYPTGNDWLNDPELNKQLSKMFNDMRKMLNKVEENLIDEFLEEGLTQSDAQAAAQAAFMKNYIDPVRKVSVNVDKFKNNPTKDHKMKRKHFIRRNPSHDQHQKTLQKLYEFAVMNLRGTLNAQHLDMAYYADDIRPLNYVLKHCIDPRVCDYAAYKKAMFLDGDENVFKNNPSRTSLKSKYQVISPDGFRIDFETPYYPTLKKAKEAFEKWKEKYERQGYYSSSQYGRIDLDELKDYCEFNKEGSEDWKPFA